LETYVLNCWTIQNPAHKTYQWFTRSGI